ncbi:MAG TPA: DNA cytosine methyltransferase [Longimicrobium sp.]
MSQAENTLSTGVHMFAGAGGMAIGLRNAGFHHSRLYEYDVHAYATLRGNGLLSLGVNDWDEHKGDVRKVDWSRIPQPVDLLAGGVPCQPFSLAGKHLAQRDGRNMFPEFFRAAEQLRPLGMFIENVAGLLREAFRPYFEYILRRLEFPSLSPRPEELWEDHDLRIRQHQNSDGYSPEYNVTWTPLDAADYGVPQNRKRVLIVATRADFPTFSFPAPTHSRAALILAQESGIYWERHGIAPLSNITHRPRLHSDDRLPWVTVRDAIGNLPAPASTEGEAEKNHWSIPGARSYHGHTGSKLDWPSKTLKAGVNGVPGGENTVVTDAGEIRYYTFREAARIQTFPDTHFFHGARKHITRQIGNAVPCLLSEVVARPLNDLLTSAAPSDTQEQPNA